MGKRLRAIVAAVAGLIALGGADAPRDRLHLYFIDVDGGAATLVVTPERESVLIDSGWPGRDDRDPRRIEHVLKDVAGLERLDHLVTTHWHMDHFGGVEGLARRVPIGHYWDRGLPDPTAPNGDRARYPDGPPQDNLLGIAYRKASAGNRTALRPGDRLPLRGEIEAVVLASGGEVWQPPAAQRRPNPLCASAPADLPPDPSDNARSLAFRFRLGGFSFLDCGDLTWNVEKKLVCPDDLIGPIDLFQVTHHGMAISNHPTLLQTIEPTVALMNNGAKKGGDPRVVRLLKSLPSLQALYQLHKNASPAPEDNTDPARIANPDPAGGEFIHVALAADGQSYTVQIGEKGAPTSYAVRSAGRQTQTSAPRSQEPSQPVFPYPVRETTLDNGLRVISVPFDSPGILAYYTVVRTGSRNEVEKGLSGFAHFFEHMMFRGTEKYPQEQYNATLKALGADSNAFTTDDWTCYHMTIPSSALPTAVELESDRFRNLKYDEPAFQKEARAVLGEYNKNASSPLLILDETMQDRAYTTHTYKHTTIGFLADVKDMPHQYAYSKTFFDRWYRPENCTIIVAGDVDHERLVGLVRQAYGSWERGRASVEIPAEPPQTAEHTAALKWPAPTLPILYMGFHIPSADPRNADHAALDALGQAVFGETSPLYQALVLDEQKAVMLVGDAEEKRDPGLFTILARVRKASDLDEVRARIEKALADAAMTTIDPARLDAIKAHLRYGFAGSLVSADAVALAVGQAIAMTDRVAAINERYAAYDRLTPADLQRVAARYFARTNETVVTLQSETK